MYIVMTRLVYSLKFILHHRHQANRKNPSGFGMSKNVMLNYQYMLLKTQPANCSAPCYSNKEIKMERRKTGIRLLREDSWHLIVSGCFLIVCKTVISLQ
jgi:hypothetical protein